MRIRLTNSISGFVSRGLEVSSIPVEFDPGEYLISTHPSGHLLVELPNQNYGFMRFEDFENGIVNGGIILNM